VKTQNARAAELVNGPEAVSKSSAMRPSDSAQERLERAQTWFSLAGYAILVVGLAVSVWAYRRAANDATDASRALLAGMQDTKSYERNLEIQGGKANVMASEIGVWFAGLWQGRHLAYTVAALAVGLALICFLIAYFLPDFPPFPPPHDTRKKTTPADPPPETR